VQQNKITGKRYIGKLIFACHRVTDGSKNETGPLGLSSFSLYLHFIHFSLGSQKGVTAKICVSILKSGIRVRLWEMIA